MSTNPDTIKLAAEVIDKQKAKIQLLRHTLKTRIDNEQDLADLVRRFQECNNELLSTLEKCLSYVKNNPPLALNVTRLCRREPINAEEGGK